MKKTIAIDVDGVPNSYVSGWTGADSMPDAPTPGAMTFLKDLVDDGRFEAVVVSSRLNSMVGQMAVRVWLDHHLRAEFGEDAARRIFGAVSLSTERPPATVTLDDRAVVAADVADALDRGESLRAYLWREGDGRPWSAAVLLVGKPSGRIREAVVTAKQQSIYDFGCSLAEHAAAATWIEAGRRGT